MGKILKLIGIAFAILVSVLILIILYLVLFLNPNQFKQPISHAIAKASGQNFTIHGDIHWKFFPSFSLQLQDAALGNPASPQPIYAKISELNLQVQLLPLIKHEILINAINIHRINIILSKTKLDKIALPISRENSHDASNLFSITNIHIDNATLYRHGESSPFIQYLQFDSQNVTQDQGFPIKISGSLKIQDSLNDFTLSGIAKLTPKQQAYQLLNTTLSLSNSKDKDRIQIKADLKLNKASLQITHLIGHWNTSNLQGNAEYDLTHKRLNFTLSLDELALNQTLESKQTSNKLPIKPSGAKPFATAFLPQTLHMVGHIKISKLRIARFNLQKGSIAINSNQGMLNLFPIYAQGYGGTITAKAKMNLKTSIAPLQIDAELSNIQAQTLLQDLKAESKLKFSGIGNLHLHSTLQGNQLQSLNGAGQFIFKQGKLTGIDIPYYIGIGQALIKKQPVPEQANSNETDFGTLTGSFVIRQGIIYNNDFTLLASQLHASGNGLLDLNQQQIDFHLLANRIDNATKTEGDTIPIAIQGPLSHPKIQPDMQAIIKLQLKKQIKKVKEEINKTLNNKIKQLNLDNMFK